MFVNVNRCYLHNYILISIILQLQKQNYKIIFLIKML